MSDDEIAFLAAIDFVSTGIALFDSGGRLLHGNDGFRRMGVTRRERFSPPPAVLAFLQQILPLPKTAARAPTSLHEAVIRRRGQTLRMRATLLPVRVFGRSDVILVCVEPTGPIPLTLMDIRSRWGLTDQQARVARLLAEGNSNADIARELTISPFTARRHTEQVLVKLGVRTRVQVAARLLDETGTDPQQPFVTHPARKIGRSTHAEPALERDFEDVGVSRRMALTTTSS